MGNASFPNSTAAGAIPGVNVAIVSPDKKRVATASRTTFLLWDAVTGNRLLKGEHADDVNALVFSPNGALLVSASDDGTVRLWDSATGQSRGDLRDSNDAVSGKTERARVVNPQGEDNTAIAERKGANARQGDAKAHDGPVVAAVFNADGSRILTKSSNGVARLWDVRTRTLITTLKVNSDKRANVALSDDGETIVTVAPDNSVRTSDGKTGRLLREFGGGREPVRTVAFSPDGKTILTTAGRMAHLWEAQTGILVAIFEGHKKDITAAAFTSDGRHILTASLDKTVRLWEPPSLHGADLVAFASTSALRRLTKCPSENILNPLNHLWFKVVT